MARAAGHHETMEETVFDSQGEEDEWPDSQPLHQSDEPSAVSKKGLAKEPIEVDI